MRLSDEQRIFLLNAGILVLIVLLIWVMPKDLVEPSPRDEEPEEPDPPPASRDSESGEEALLVLLSEYNYDYEPRIRAAATTGVGLCDSMPLIEMPPCTPPVSELAFAMESRTTNGWLGYATYADEATARSFIGSIARIDTAADGGYVSIERGIERITDHEIYAEPDDALVLFRPVGTRYEHAWIVRFGALLIYGYERTDERTITRKFTHAFDPELRERVIGSYNLSYADFGFDAPGVP